MFDSVGASVGTERDGLPATADLLAVFNRAEPRRGLSCSPQRPWGVHGQIERERCARCGWTAH